MFHGREDAARSEHVLHGLLFALCAADASYLRAHPETPRLYESGVRYQAELPGREDWQTVPFALARGVADCEDLACWRVAELWVRDGVRALPRMTWRPKGPRGQWRLYHITVRWPDGHVEDPSRVLGMGRRRGSEG